MTQAERRLSAVAKEAVAAARSRRLQGIIQNWGMGQARTCLVCGDVLLTKKDLRIHRAKHTEMKCEKTATT